MGDIRQEVEQEHRLTWCLALLSFAVPIFIMCVVAVSSNVYPFGSNAFIAWDEKYQYIDFFTWFKGVLAGTNSIFYSGAQGLGADGWGMFGYYLSSPLNILVAFFSVEDLELCLFVITALKLGLAGIAMSFFIRRRFGISQAFTLIFACCYAWSAWSATQMSNILWMDALYLLPLVLWAGYCFANRGSWKLLTLSLAAAVATCWYTAYMLMLFGALYTIFELYVRHVQVEAVSVRYVLKRAAGYAGSLALALILSAFTFLPTVEAMMASDDGMRGRSLLSIFSDSFARKGIQISDPQLIALAIVAILVLAVLVGLMVSKRIPRIARIALAVLVALVLIVATFIVGQAGSPSLLFTSLVADGQILWETPQLYCGMGTLVLFGAFFACKQIPGRIRVAVGVFVFVMILSCWCPYMYVWTCFRIPGGFYCRMAFLATVPLLWAAAYALLLVQKGELGKKSIVFGGSMTLVIVVLALLVGGELALSETFLDGIAVIIWTVLLVLCLRPGEMAAKIGVVCAMLLLCCAELSVNGTDAWLQSHGADNDQRESSYTHQEYLSYVDSANEQLEALTSIDGSLYRFDKTYTRADGAALSESEARGYLALSSYTSAHDGHALSLLSALGYGDQDDFAIQIVGSLPLSDSLFGLKYVASRYPVGAYEDIGLTSIGQGSRIYRNPYVLGLGYGVSSRAAQYSLSQVRNPFASQNDLVKSLIDSDQNVYVELETTQYVQSDGSVQWQVTVPAGYWGYVYVQGELADEKKCTLTVDDEETSEAWRFNHNIRNLNDDTSAVSDHMVTLSYDAADAKSEPTCLFYGIKVSDVERVCQELATDTPHFSVYEDGNIAGTFTATREDEYLMLTIPNDEGWTATVNGKQVATQGLANGACMLIPVTQGENSFQLTYVSPGFVPGCGLTAIGVILFVALCLIGTRRKKRQAIPGESKAA